MLANWGSGIASRLIRWSCHVRTQEPAWQVGQVQVNVAGCFSTTSRLTWKLGKSRIKFLHLASCDHKQHIGQLVGHLSAEMGNGRTNTKTKKDDDIFRRWNGGVRYCTSCIRQNMGMDRRGGMVKKHKHKNDFIA